MRRKNHWARSRRRKRRVTGASKARRDLDWAAQFRVSTEVLEFAVEALSQIGTEFGAPPIEECMTKPASEEPTDVFLADDDDDPSDVPLSRSAGQVRFGRAHHEEPKRRREPRRPPCEVPGCGKGTTERKPFCTDHVELCSKEAQRISRELKAMQAEFSSARRGKVKKIDVDGIVCQDMIEILTSKGSQNFKRLAIELEIPSDSLDGYVRALERAGKVKKLVLGSRRGTPRVVVALA